MKITILMGGDSSERDVSIMTGVSVYEALKPHHEINLIELGSDLNVIPPNCIDSDIIFLALHGGIGENGEIQSFLDRYSFIYTGSGSKSSKMAFNKHLTKRFAIDNNIPTPKFIYHEMENESDAFNLPDITFKGPYVVKPSNEGSTMGLSIVNDKSQLPSALLFAYEFSNQILIEKYIDGREMTVAIIGNKCLPIVEISPKNDLYDYESKYTKGMSDYSVPADLPNDIALSMKNDSLKLYNSLGCSNYARVDFRVGFDDSYHMLEINTLPGLTSTSLLPLAAKEVGLDYRKLIETIISIALLKDTDG